MRIFSRKKKENTEEITLRQMEPQRTFDVFAALAKALLLFLLVYGAVGGFLSAYDIDYNKGICMLLIFLFGLFLSLLYETGKRWLINLMNVVVLAAYFYIAIVNYWVINSGYYAIMNRILEVARNYLNIANGTDYALVVEEEYMTVTVFALFISMVCCILLNIHLQNKARLWKVMLLTLTPYIFPFYFKRSPSLIYMMLLFIGYGTIAILQGTDVRKHLTGQVRYVLPVVTVFVILLVRLAAFLIPQRSYELRMPDNERKMSTENTVARFTQFGMMAFFRDSRTGSGISGGMLSKGSAVMSDYETDLIVRYTPYSYQPVYLKAFTGKDYEGTRWTKAGSGWAEDDGMAITILGRISASADTPDQQGVGIMEIENVGASTEYEYLPYYTAESATVKQGNKSIYTYYPPGGMVNIQYVEVDPAYLTVPDSCLAAVQNVCDTAGFSGTPEEIAGQIVAYFAENYSYTLRPGIYFGSSDYITHFLLESKRGYCAHFASAGTMLFRYMGIPARYVEGYAFSYYDVVMDGKLVEDAKYSDYYTGFAPIGETGLVELEVPDARAHGWVEIYIPGRGWIVVDPTPSSTEEEDTTSFWEAFLNNDGTNGQLNLGADTIGAYLESAMGGISYILLGGGLLTLGIFWIGHTCRLRRERKLPQRMQVQLEYGRLKNYLLGKYDEFSAYRTVREQLDFVRARYDTEITAEQEEALYQAFFGPDADKDEQELLAFLKQLRKICRKRPTGK